MAGRVFANPSFDRPNRSERLVRIDPQDGSANGGKQLHRIAIGANHEPGASEGTAVSSTISGRGSRRYSRLLSRVARKKASAEDG